MIDPSTFPADGVEIEGDDYIARVQDFEREADEWRAVEAIEIVEDLAFLPDDEVPDFLASEVSNVVNALIAEDPLGWGVPLITWELDDDAETIRVKEVR